MAQRTLSCRAETMSDAKNADEQPQPSESLERAQRRLQEGYYRESQVDVDKHGDGIIAWFFEQVAAELDRQGNVLVGDLKSTATSVAPSSPELKRVMQEAKVQLLAHIATSQDDCKQSDIADLFGNHVYLRKHNVKFEDTGKQVVFHCRVQAIWCLKELAMSLRRQDAKKRADATVAADKTN